MQNYDVVIIGAGPAGLSAATHLHALGMKDVVVLERESEAGGVPRHCGHLGFGWQSHHRIWSGPRFANELRKQAQAIDVRTQNTVLEIDPSGELRVQTVQGVTRLKARHVLIATGTRETPRAARLVGGTRPMGVMNTGSLQQHVYLHGYKPFERPIIIGTEWVSFSAILTCRHLGITPVAMLEENSRTTAPRPGALISRFCFGVPVHTSTRLVAIEGRSEVEAVIVEQASGTRRMPCDGVIFTGQFHPETTIMPQGQLPHTITCTGNILAPLKTSGECWVQGKEAAQHIARRLS